MSDFETSFTVWKRCGQCGTMNNERRSDCRECGLLFTERRQTERQEPDQGAKQGQE
jgi:uncharacterized membrane protein YvbJ